MGRQGVGGSRQGVGSRHHSESRTRQESNRRIEHELESRKELPEVLVPGETGGGKRTLWLLKKWLL